ncbi:MAG: ankyrin repeat domain-containing protein [Candidatus Sericytochromatia bacterium]
MRKNIFENYKIILGQIRDEYRLKAIIEAGDIDFNITFGYSYKNIFYNDFKSNIRTILMECILIDYNYENIKYLLEKGANPNIMCKYLGDITYCIHEIILNSSRILEGGWEHFNIPPEAIGEWYFKDYITEEGVKLLVEHGAEVNVKNARGQTPLDIAILCEIEPIINYLISVGAKKGSELSEEETYVYKTAPGEMQYHLVFWHEEYPPPEDEDLPDF